MAIAESNTSKMYAQELYAREIRSVLALAIAFSGKHVLIKAKPLSPEEKLLDNSF